MASNQNILEKLHQIGIIRHDFTKVIYKYMPIETAKLILTHRTLMFQSPLNFNDPFELHLGLLDCIPKNGKTIEIYEKYFSRGKLLSDELKAYLEKDGDSLLQKTFEKTFIDYRKNVGVTCFTENPTNALMWSHYASSHKGVCLGLIIEGWNRVIDTFHVNYAQSITPINYFDDNENEIAFWYWMFTKSHVWSYEKEIRCVNMFSNGIKPLDDIKVKEIYYGAGIGQQDMDDLEILLENYQITKRVKMEINPKTFDLVETLL